MPEAGLGPNKQGWGSAASTEICKTHITRTQVLSGIHGCCLCMEKSSWWLHTRVKVGKSVQVKHLQHLKSMTYKRVHNKEKEKP